MPRPTVRSILQRRRDDVAELEGGNALGPCRGIDLTLVWGLGVVPVWLIGRRQVLDFIALRPVAPTSASVVAVLEELSVEHGRPATVMTDNGGQFVAARFRDALRLAGVRHLRIRPGHPWTNGKTERIFRTEKELQRFYAPLLASLPRFRSFRRILARPGLEIEVLREAERRQFVHEPLNGCHHG